MFATKEGMPSMEVHHGGRAQRFILSRIDSAVMYVFIAAWLGVGLWSGLFVGDTLLLLIPIIFCCATILIFLISQSFRGRGIVGGVFLIALNAWLLSHYPM